jgi:hypothetical protein
MPWFRVDDNLAFHPKIMRAGNAAIGLWARAGSWSAQQLTEGHVPLDLARNIGTRGEADRLVSVGLWLRTDDGYQFHQWAERQPPKSKVEADREAARKRQHRARELARLAREERDLDVTA